jgi:glycosyltransferase involved in cell wall biosynthesis
MRILALSDYYLPGYAAGGPIRSLGNLTEALGDEYSFSVLTRDRDMGASEPPAGVRYGEWVRVDRAAVRYLAPSELSLRGLARAIRSRDHDVLYVNSLFSVPFGIKPLLLRRLGVIPRRALVIAPRGELSEGALALHPGRKRMYLGFARRLGLFRDAHWQASSQHEAVNVREQMGDLPLVLVAPNVPPRPAGSGSAPREPKRPGRLRIVFLSRIVPMKNLLGALELLSGTDGEVRFDVYGPAEDAAYWSKCQKAMARLPAGIDCRYHGDIAPEQVQTILARYDLFFLPTQGESFGHVILEAMLAGCPVLITDRTPWRGLADAGVGWDLPVDETDDFRAVLERCLSMDDVEHRRLSDAARRYALDVAAEPDLLELYRSLFTGARG